MDAWRARHAAGLRLLTSDVESKDWNTVPGSVQTRDSESPSPGASAPPRPDGMKAWRARFAATARFTREDCEEDEICNNMVLGFWQDLVDMSEPSVSEESQPAEAPDVDKDEASPSATSSRSTESTRSTARSTRTGKLGARSSKP